MAALTFTAYGTPQPQGSSSAFIPKGWTRAVVTSANPKNKGWREVVGHAAHRARVEGRAKVLTGPVRLMVAFYLPRPKSLSRYVLVHVKKPDTDKLIRSVCDALTGVVWKDDSQVIQVKATKDYAGQGERPRAVITVQLLDPVAVAPRSGQLALV